MVSISDKAVGEVATLIVPQHVLIQGGIDKPPTGEKRAKLVLVHWPRHGSFPEYIPLTPDFVRGVERNLFWVEIYGQGCFGGGIYHDNAEKELAKRLLRQKLQDVGVGLEDIVDLLGRKTNLIDVENNQVAYTGVILNAPGNEERAKFVLAHKISEKSSQVIYTNKTYTHKTL